MRLGRIASPDGVAFVSIEGPPDDPNQTVAREIAEHPFGTPTFTGRQWPLADVRLLAPILASKVVCIGKNYAAHVAEMGGGDFPDPVMFMKPNTAIIGPNVPIRAAGRRQPGALRGRARRRHRPAVQGRARRPRRREHPGLHDRQRRVGARSAEEGRPVDPGERARHVLPDRPVDRHRSRSRRRGDSYRGQRRDPNSTAARR